MQESAKKASQEPTLPELSRDVPSTPAGRLALPDLIGMGDVQRMVQDVSPDERIEWDHDKDTVYSQIASFGSVRRARKRARSSSPTTSSPRVSAHFNPKAESPQLDPGSELWGRYSLNASNALTPQGPPVPALAHLMYTSSPQPYKECATPRSANGFRRANSCGNQFPKRRRVRGPDGDDVFTGSANIGPSKLSVLIERVQEGLSQPQMSLPSLHNSRHSSKRRRSEFENDSPRHQSHREEIEASPPKAKLELAAPMARQRLDSVTPKLLPLNASSSDYGDDDFDESLLEAFRFSEADPISDIPNYDKTELFQKPSHEASPTTSKKSLGTITAVSTCGKSAVVDVRDDEFDELDDEILNEDLEVIFSQFDERALMANKNTAASGVIDRVSKPQNVREKSITDFDDEFGSDGLDDLDFETGEATATRSTQQTANSVLPVRTRFS